jgi:hypothetical protein
MRTSVRYKTQKIAPGDWPFRQLKATPLCGTVTALTRTEFSLTFLGFSSASRASFLLAGAVSIK